jgi:glycosyltransferase involved in cell wall biosynthesis
MGRQIRGFYAVSPGYAKRIERTGLICVSGVLPNPVDTDLFRPEFAENKEIFRIVTTGDLGLLKGTDLLFEALRLLPNDLNWSVTLFGEVGDCTRFSQWLENQFFANRVSLPGKVSQADLVRAYSLSDLFVVSSRSETANISMLEAMACGLPVVTTCCGGPETLIDDTVGIAVQPNDPQTLATGILQVARNPQLYDRDAQRRFVLERYSKPVVAKRVIDAYQVALKKSKRQI